jgi:imidazoleglycerol-phosphate dehydratase
MLNSLAKHGRLGIMLTCKGDLHVDDHHTVEDCALVLGQALDQALDTRNGIVRFGNSYAPLDEALARAVVDLSGRPYSMIALDLTDDRIGELRCENIAHFLHSFATAAKLNLHVDMIRGANDHHKAEAAFKATALALRQAVSLDGSTDVPSTKGVLV